MNNNIKFDPMTGEPINNFNQPTVSIENIQPKIVAETPIIENEQQEKPQNTINNNTIVQNELNNIPTVDQNEQKFINNIQEISKDKQAEKKQEVNFIFLIKSLISKKQPMLHPKLSLTKNWPIVHLGLQTRLMLGRISSPTMH